MLTSIENDIAKKELEKRKLEKKNPALIAIAPANGNQERFDPVAEKQKIDLLGVKINSLTNSLEKARKEQTRIYDVERGIKELELKKAALDKNYMFFLTALEKAQFDAALGSSRNSSISILENPTLPAVKMKSLVKKMAMAVGGGLFIGVGLALLLELFVNQGVKRPIELQRLLPVPLFISIPKIAHRIGTKQLTNGSAQGELGHGNGQTKLIARGTESEDEELQPYFEALRDRVLNRFENLSRKPKLVGVCGCAEGRSSSTTAAGLAAALSEAGDLKVLLVDMKPGSRGSVRSARRSCTLLEALGEKKREEALIAPNLYVASAEDGESAKAVTSPRRFTTVVPQLNASDYDYVVFDMPVVDQISVTPRLAKYMDLTLLVVEADKAHRNAVKQAGALLLEFTPKMATVMHNAEANLPKWLQDAL
jgi:Mrp family chromosome partitioning ATPase